MHPTIRSSELDLLKGGPGTCEGCKKGLKEKSHAGGKKNRFPIRCAGTGDRKCPSKLCRKCWYACVSTSRDVGMASGFLDPEKFKYWKCGPCCRSDSIKCCECKRWTNKTPECIYDCQKCGKRSICEGCIGNDIEHERDTVPLCTECVSTCFWCDSCEVLVSVFEDPEKIPVVCGKEGCKAVLCFWCWDEIRRPWDHGVESDFENFDPIKEGVDDDEYKSLTIKTHDSLNLWYCSSCHRIDDI